MLFRAAFPTLVLAVLATGPAPAGAAALITDPASQCATSNPHPQGQETIKWTGACRDGLLDGRGTLTWFRDGRWTERNEGTFRAGEMHGDAMTTFPDGSTISGTYADGRRHGEFILSRTSGNYTRAIYRDDQLVEERPLTRQQVRTLLAQRQQAGSTSPAPAARAQAPAALAPSAPAAPAPVAMAPAPAAAATGAAAPFPLPAPAVPSMAYAKSLSPPWSPSANAAVVAGYPPAPPAPATARAVAQPAWTVPYGGPPQTYAAAYQPIAPAAAPVTTPAVAPPVATPVSAQPAATSQAGPYAPGILASPRRVCTTPGLYPKGAGWCGVVRREQGEEIEVELTEVRVNSLFAIGIGASECTGSEFVPSGGRGRRIWVPARCTQ